MFDAAATAMETWQDAEAAFLSEDDADAPQSQQSMFQDMEAAAELDSTDDVAEPPELELLSAAPEPRKRGRPKGTFGTRAARQAAANLPSSESSPERAAPVLDRLAVARQHKRQNQLAIKQAATEAAATVSADPLLHQGAAIWELLAFQGDPVQRALNCSARCSFEEQTDADRANTVASFLAKESIPMMSNKALQRYVQSSLQSQAGRVAGSEPKLIRAMRDLAAGAIYGSGLLWAGFLRAVEGKLSAPESERALPDGEPQWEGILLIKKSRYDETPLRIRLDSASAEIQASVQETAEHGKVMQTEFGLHLLVAERTGPDQKFLHLHGAVPSNLMVVDRTTAEATKAVILAQQSRVVGLESTSQQFCWTLQLACVDRYASNLKAEKALLAEQVQRDSSSALPPRITKFTKTCDIHVAAQVQCQTGQVVSDDISGLLHTALAQYGSGVLIELRNILGDIFQNELQVIYDHPPAGRAQDFRMSVYDLYLPVAAAEPADVPRQAVLRRHVLSNLCNGSLESREIIHYCPFGCCSSYEHTVWKFKKYATWALLPTKCPKLIRSKWTGQEGAVSWAGLLDSHYGLLRRVMTRFANGHQKVVQPMALRAQAANHSDEEAAFLLDSDAPKPLPLQVDVSTALVADDSDEAEAFDADMRDRDATETAAEVWVRKNKQFKRNAGRWAETSPGPRLAVFRQTMSLTARLVNKLLQISGAAWEKKQEQSARRLGQRTFRMLEAASGADMKHFFDGCVMHLTTTPEAVPLWAMKTMLRGLHFRMLARAGASLHMLMRIPRQSYPYKLFLALDPSAADPAAYTEAPACELDELAHAFKQHFPQWTDAAKACLQTLGAAIECDVAGIESRHASSRRLSLLKGLHTWVPSVQSLAADFAVRQMVLKEKVLPDPAAKSVPPPQKKRVGKQPNAKGGGAGAYRAYMHVHHKGEKMSAESIRRHTAAFRALPADEMQKYYEMGQLGLAAWRAGFSSFGDRVQKARASPARAVLMPDETGVIVAPDSGAVSALVPLSTRDFQEDFRLIRRTFAEHAAERQSKQQEETAADEALSTAALASTTAVFTDTPNSKASFQEASLRTEPDVHTAKWFPPGLRFASVLGQHIVR